MTSPIQFALAYITRSPEAAGRLLSSMPPDASAAFLGEIPTPLAVTLVANLQPATAARIFGVAGDKVAAAIFRDLDSGKSSAVVRQMDRATRHQFLSKLSKRTRTGLEKSLSFAPGTVGAHMTTAIATLSQTDSAGAVLDTIRQPGRDPVDLVFVLNDAGHLVGVVSSVAALRYPEATLLSAVLDSSCPQVSAHNRLDAIADPALWHDFAYLPVVNRRREVIGAISRKVLNPGHCVDTAVLQPASQSVPVSMFKALATTSAGLLNLVSNSAAGVAQHGERSGH